MLVKLNKVSIVDLNVRYSRPMGGNKLTHYKASFAQVYLGSDPLDEIKKIIEKEEGFNDVELQVTEVPHASSLIVEDASEVVFANGKHKKVKKALSRRKSQGLIDQAVHLTFAEKLLAPFVYVYNAFAKLANKLLAKYYGIDPETAHIHQMVSDHFNLLPERYFMFKKLTLGTRIIDLVHFLTVAFEESQSERAVAKLMKDLSKLEDLGLIKGHLAMPCMIKLADTVGAGEHYYAIFCFPLIDSVELSKHFKDGTPVNYAKNNLKEVLGIESSCAEHEMHHLDNKSFESKWDITEVDVFAAKNAEAYATYIESTKEYVEAVKKFDSEQAEKAKNWDKKFSS